MREQKYRAWYYATQTMLDSLPLKGFEDLNSVFESPEYDIMEWTGMQDRKTVDIYEGDRVKVYEIRHNRWFTGTVQMIDGCWEVVFDHPWVNMRPDGQAVYQSRMYLKVYVANHAVDVQGHLSSPPPT